MNSEIIPYTQSQVLVKTDQNLPLHITFDEFKKIYYSLAGRDQILCGLMWETGGRISDILNLKWKDIDMDIGMIRLYIDKRDITINVPIGQSMVSDLKNHKIHIKPDNDTFIFESDSKFHRLTRQAVHKKTKSWGKKIGRELNPHMWRHGLAIHLLANGVNIKVIAARLGHANVFTTMNTYLVITPELQRDLIKHVPMR